MCNIKAIWLPEPPACLNLVSAKCSSSPAYVGKEMDMQDARWKLGFAWRRIPVINPLQLALTWLKYVQLSPIVRASLISH